MTIAKSKFATVNESLFILATVFGPGFCHYTCPLIKTYADEHFLLCSLTTLDRLVNRGPTNALRCLQNSTSGTVSTVGKKEANTIIFHNGLKFLHITKT